ncbi:MAG: ComEC/Rec2 family competence protein, partial [Arcanobacterium sp.]|nr:ComEC/Rec2 family competence protein [Arcanobacterium sp.]
MHDYRLFTPAVVIWFLVINYKNITLWGCALFKKIAGIDIPNCLGFIILSSLGLFAIVCCLVLVRELTKVIFSFEVVQVFALRGQVGTEHLSSVYYPKDADNRGKHSLSRVHCSGIKFLLAALGVSIFAVAISQELIAADEAEFFAQRSSAVTGILESVPTGTFPVGGGEIQEVETGGIDGEGRPHKQQRELTLPKGIILYSKSTGFRICLKGSPEFSQLSQGQVVRVFGALKESKFGVCEFELRAAKIETLASASVIQKYAGRMKQEFLSPAVQQQQLSAAQALARGVIFGDSQFFVPDDERAMRISGLKHLTAISGTHISILLIGTLTVIGKRNRRFSAIVATLIVLFLLLLIGPGASVIRAGLMALFLLLGLFLGKRTDSLPLLAVVVIIESLWHPQTAIGIGFQLSVVTTAGIVILVPYLEKVFASLHAGKILKVLTLPLIAGTVSLPLIMRIQEEISFLGVLANILSSPVVPILTITGMISAVCIPIFPALQLLTLPVIELCSAWILFVARSVAGLEIFIATPFSVFLFNAFVLLILLILAKIFSFQKEKVQFPRRKFPSLFFSVLEDGGGKGAGKFFQYFRKLFQFRKYGMLGGYFLLGICATTSVIFSSWIIGAKLSGASQGINWQIVQCDVGQGSALIVKEKDLVVLIDAGPPNSKAVQCLKNNDINKLDLLVLTHLDLDHVGGVAEILQQVLV